MKVYDLESHYYLPELMEFLKTRKTPPMIDARGILTYHEGASIPTGEPIEYWGGHTLEEVLTDAGEIRIKYMDEAGIDVAVISSSALIEALPREEAIQYARKTNDAIAAACQAYPDRFMGTICLPAPYVEESIQELERAVNELGLKYWHTHSNFGEEILSDDKFIPLLAKCEEMGIAIYLHPHMPVSDYFVDPIRVFSGAGFGFGVDTMKTSIKMVLSGRFDQFPKLQLILGHMGEFYPYLMERLDNRFFWLKDDEVKCAHNFTYYFKNKNILITTSGIEDPDVAMLAIKKIGVDSIMMGSDYPFEIIKHSVDYIRDLPISGDDKAKIMYKNTEKYLL